MVFQSTILEISSSDGMHGQRPLPQKELALALCHAVWQNNEEATKQLLDTVPSLVWNSIFENSESIGFYSPLHHSVASGNEKITRLLLDSGIRPDVRDKSGNTPLIWAAMNGSENLVLELLESGANPNIQNFKGETALFVAVERGHKPVVLVLVENSANVNVPNLNGETPLHSSVKAINLEVVQYLLSRGSFVNAQDEEGDSALHHAARVDDENTMKKLFQLLESFGANFDLENEDGETPKELIEIFFQRV